MLQVSQGEMLASQGVALCFFSANTLSPGVIQIHRSRVVQAIERRIADEADLWQRS